MGWDRALRSLVAAAWQVRGTPESSAACARIVEAWELWPLAEVELALQAARTERDARRAHVEELVLLLRSTYVDSEVRVAA